MELNGKPLTRELIREYLAEKRVILWMDWLITEPSQMDLAIDWFMGECHNLAAA